ncbi:MAG: CPBP family intramembrane glutamic endopeptidase [Phycisphaerae bacterium]|nr:CPBP family intramembrane glutamic endopeptidase [Phycisphaerae bacterium]
MTSRRPLSPVVLLGLLIAGGFLISLVPSPAVLWTTRLSPATFHIVHDGYQFALGFGVFYAAKRLSRAPLPRLVGGATVKSLVLAVGLGIACGFGHRAIAAAAENIGNSFPEFRESWPWLFSPQIRIGGLKGPSISGWIEIAISSGLTSFAEELIFRGVILWLILRLTRNPTIAIAISAVWFGGLHWRAGFVSVISAGAVAGVATGWLALRTRSVVCAGLLHWVTNLTIYFLVLATR